MIDNALDRDLQAGLLAVRRAARATLCVQQTLTADGTLQKGDKSPVTVADFAAQALVVQTLAEHFPNDAIVGEEDAEELREDDNRELRQRVLDAVNAVASAETSMAEITEQQLLDWIDRGDSRADVKRYWVLDPIDGTKGFLRKGQYAIALGLVENGRVVAGVMGCPSYAPTDGGAPGMLLFARRGQGAFEMPLHGDPKDAVRMQATQQNDTAVMRFCESVESGHSDQGTSGTVAAELGIRGAPVRMDSQAKYVAVARGDADIYMRLPTRKDYREKVWDHAAGMILVEEAGGTVTDVDGKSLDFTQGRKLEQNRGVLASNGVIHDRLVAAVTKALAGG